MNNLEIAKRIIKENYKNADCGLFDCRNIVGDIMVNIYDADGLSIDICFDYSYFEVFGLTEKEFEELLRFYETLEGVGTIRGGTGKNENISVVGN